MGLFDFRRKPADRELNELAISLRTALRRELATAQRNEPKALSDLRIELEKDSSAISLKQVYALGYEVITHFTSLDAPLAQKISSALSAHLLKILYAADTARQKPEAAEIQQARTLLAHAAQAAHDQDIVEQTMQQSIRLQQEIEGKKIKIEEYEATLEKLNTQIKKNQAAMIETTQQIATLLHQVTAQQQLTRHLQQEIEQKQRTLTTLNERLKEETQAREKVTAQLNETVGQYEEAQRTILNLTVQLNESLAGRTNGSISAHPTLSRGKQEEYKSRLKKALSPQRFAVLCALLEMSPSLQRNFAISALLRNAVLALKNNSFYQNTADILVAAFGNIPTELNTPLQTTTDDGGIFRVSFFQGACFNLANFFNNGYLVPQNTDEGKYYDQLKPKTTLSDETYNSTLGAGARAAQAAASTLAASSTNGNASFDLSTTALNDAASTPRAQRAKRRAAAANTASKTAPESSSAALGPDSPLKRHQTNEAPTGLTPGMAQLQTQSP